MERPIKIMAISQFYSNLGNSFKSLIMLNFKRFFMLPGLILFWGFTSLCYTQSYEETNRQLIVLEKEYNDLLQEALRSQVKADSLIRISNLKRREIESTRDISDKARLSNEVLELEKEAIDIQAETNRKYTAAREMEVRLLTLKRSIGETQEVKQPTLQIKPVEAKKEEILLLTFLFGKPEIEQFVGPTAVASLKSVEKQALEVNKIFNEVSEINQEIENLKMQIDLNPRSRKNRAHRKQIGELEKNASVKNLQALTAIESVNRVKIEVLTDVVNASKVNVTSRDVLQKASVHEDAAKENLREAAESRKVANELSTEKFSHDYMMRAYQKELVTMDELIKAFDLFAGKAEIKAVAEVSRTLPEVAKPVLPEPLKEKAQPEVTEVKEQISVPVKKENESFIPLNISLPAGLIYRIQIGIYQNDVAIPDFGSLPDLSGESEEGNGTTRYFTGLYPRFGEAERALLDVRRVGFRDAFIVSYMDGRRIPVNRAVSLEREREDRPGTPVVAPVTKPVPVAEVKETSVVKEQSADRVVFKVQIGVFRNLISEENRDRFMRLAEGQKLEFTQNNAGLYVYTIGNFDTFEEAVQARDKIVAGGLKDSFVVVFKNSERIPLNQVVK
jgi:hypothetical protein